MRSLSEFESRSSVYARTFPPSIMRQAELRAPDEQTSPAIEELAPQTIYYSEPVIEQGNRNRSIRAWGDSTLTSYLYLLWVYADTSVLLSHHFMSFEGANCRSVISLWPTNRLMSDAPVPTALSGKDGASRCCTPLSNSERVVHVRHGFASDTSVELEAEFGSGGSQRKLFSCTQIFTSS
jgi:hypothetical protein